MVMRVLSAALAVGLVVAGFAAPATAAEDKEPTLLGRAILPSDAYQPGPPSGAFITGDNGVTPPFPGQPIPGFSAVLDAGHGEFWAMPDNGYGAKTNSGDFLLRLYRIRPDFTTADRWERDGGRAGLRPAARPRREGPVRAVPAGSAADRARTSTWSRSGGRKDGSFWFGEEFGPFLLHTDATGRVLEAPVPLPGVQSPQNPFLPDPDAWTLPASRGFEGTARSIDGKTAVPDAGGRASQRPRPAAADPE